MKHPNEQELDNQIKTILSKAKQYNWWQRFILKIMLKYKG